MVTMPRKPHSENGRTKSQYSAENHTFITVVKAKIQYICRRSPTFPTSSGPCSPLRCQVSNPKASNASSSAPQQSKAVGPAKQYYDNTPTLSSPLRPTHHPPHPHNVRLRPHPLRNSRARRSFRPPGPEGALRAAARPARCLLRLCWQVRWRCRRPRPPPRGVFRGVHCQVCRSCVCCVFGRGG